MSEKTTTQRGACTFTIDGKTYTTEREVIRFDDWRETAFGEVNFGLVRLGPQRIVETHP